MRDILTTCHNESKHYSLKTEQHKQHISGIAAPLGCLARSTACAARGSI